MEGRGWESYMEGRGEEYYMERWRVLLEDWVLFVT